MMGVEEGNMGRPGTACDCKERRSLKSRPGLISAITLMASGKKKPSVLVEPRRRLPTAFVISVSEISIREWAGI